MAQVPLYCTFNVHFFLNSVKNRTLLLRHPCHGPCFNESSFIGYWRHWSMPVSRRASTTAIRFYPRQRTRSLTSCSECWMPLQVWSRTPASTIVDWRSYCMKICTGWMCPVASAVQACCDRSPSFPGSSTNVRHWLLCPGLRRCRSPSSAICRCPSTDCTTCSSKHVWFSCLRLCRSSSLEFTTICATQLLGTTGFDPTWKRSCLLSCNVFVDSSYCMYCATWFYVLLTYLLTWNEWKYNGIGLLSLCMYVCMHLCLHMSFRMHKSTRSEV